MASELKNLNDFSKSLSSNVKGKKIAIVVAEWNEDICKALYKGAKDYLIKSGVWENNIETIEVPGSYELIYASNLLAQKDDIDGVLALGCVIKGETKHDEYISNAVAQSLGDITIKYNKPITFGLLTTNTEQQAKDRSGGKHGNKGTEAAYTLLRMLEL